MTLSGSKKFFFFFGWGERFVSFMIGSYLELQSIAAYTVWQMEGPIPQAIAPATHSLFQFKQNLWLKPLKAQPFQVYSWFSPQGEFSELPLSCHALSDGLPQRVVCLCNAQMHGGIGDLCPACQAVPQ